LYFFRRGMTKESLNCTGKTPVFKDRLTSVSIHYIYYNEFVGTRV